MTNAADQLKLIGGFLVSIRGRSVTVSANAARLLAVLALDGPTVRAQMAGLLWPEKNERRALANLRSTLWRLRSKNVDVVEEDSLVTLSLRPDLLVDMHEGLGQETAERLDVELLLRELLPGWPEPWLELHRLKWRQTRLHAIDRLCDHHISLEEWDVVRAVAQKVVQHEPVRETSVRHFVHGCLGQDDLGGAQREIHRYRQALHGELGAVASPQLELLERECQVRGSH